MIDPEASRWSRKGLRLFILYPGLHPSSIVVFLHGATGCADEREEGEKWSNEFTLFAVAQDRYAR